MYVLDVGAVRWAHEQSQRRRRHCAMVVFSSPSLGVCDSTSPHTGLVAVPLAVSEDLPHLTGR